MSVRTTTVTLVVAVVAGLCIGSSAAADHGHNATRDAMDAEVQQAGAPGVLGRAEDGGGVWSGASGVADRRTHRPRLAQDRFRIGSLTKPFIATVLLELEAEGKLDLDDTVERWLPGTVRGQGNDGRRVTLRQLLRHTSGVYDFAVEPRVEDAYFGPGFLAHRYDTHAPTVLVRTATAHSPYFAPGTKWRYSNTNYVLAGMVVEKVTGHSYAREVDRRIIRPLGLRDTSLPGTSAAIPGMHGRAYSTLLRSGSRAPVHDVTRLNPSIAGASGEMISSNGDLIRFMRALLSGEVLPSRQLQEMKSTVRADGGYRYGLGLTQYRLSCGITLWGHEGTIQGSRSTAVTTADGSHSAAFNINGDWAGETKPLIEAEFCG
jgi:D-alanyl-D-alanine carboxypeptidase